MVPLILPPFVGAIGLRLVVGRFGPLTQIFGGSPLGIDWIGKFRLPGIVIVEALNLYPILLLNLQASLANIDPSLEMAAANLGASRWTIFRRVTLPLIRPGLFAGSTLVLIWSFTELGTPLIFNFYTITPVQVFQQILEVSSSPIPYALVVVLLMASTLLYLGGKVALGRLVDASTTKASVSSTPIRLRGLHAFAAFFVFMAVFLLAVVPHLSVVLTSFAQTGSWYQSILPRRIHGRALHPGPGGRDRLSQCHSLHRVCVARDGHWRNRRARRCDSDRPGQSARTRSDGRALHASPGRAGSGSLIRIPGDQHQAQSSIWRSHAVVS